MELHPLCSLFPEFSEEDCCAIAEGRIGASGIRDDGLAIAWVRPHRVPGYLHLDHCNVQTKEHLYTKQAVDVRGVQQSFEMMAGNRRFAWTVDIKARPCVGNYSQRWVYFIQAIGGGLVKIGSSYDPTSRLIEFQCGSPVVLRIVKTVPAKDSSLEYRIHKKFAHLRVRGEWFRPEVLETDVVALTEEVVS